MTGKTWTIFIVICAAVLGGLIWVSNSGKANVSDVDPNAVQRASDENGNIPDHVYGKVDSKVVFIEYADFQCPGCAGMNPLIVELKEQYKDKVAFVYRNMPLLQIHANARFASSAAEAAGLQGKYWEMNNLIFEKQSSWKDLSTNERLNAFVSYAESLSLNIDKFKTDIEHKDVAKKIAFDQALASKAQLKLSTPTLVLNGKVLTEDDTKDKDAIAAAIDRVLKDNGIEPPVDNQ